MIDSYEGIAIIVQARLNSSRLPGKALLDLEGKPILYRVLNSIRDIPANYFILACAEGTKEYFKDIVKEPYRKRIENGEPLAKLTKDILEEFNIKI